MTKYVIGDIQGCASALDHLLREIEFSPSRDTLYVLGDLINRGPDNLGVLRRLHRYGDSAQCLLGNHDFHALALHLGLVSLKPQDTLQDLLAAPDRVAWMDWLRHRALALHEDGVLMVHAGVLPQWSTEQTLALAKEVQTTLQSSAWKAFIAHLYGNQPAKWHPDLQGHDRLRVIVNGLTRLRFCTTDGEMEFAHHGDVNDAPQGFMPWFEVPDRLTANQPIVFGHWSRLRKPTQSNVTPLDTGCVWGGCLTALVLTERPSEWRFHSVDCPKATEPV